ncbi:MAG TPA: metallophosphoesterase [Spirochaetota bacterium]|nr:metallophosphoesterase [Spirochaetota bacterium]
MRLIYLTDIHGDFEKLRSILFDTIADIYIISGDLIDIPFYNMDSAIRYHDLQSYFNSLRKQMEKEDVVLEDFVEDLLELPEISDEIQERGYKYQQYTIRARRVMQQKYKVVENLLLSKPGGQSFCLPGNYDMDLKYTALHERDLHMHWHSIENLKIAGYGGADIFTAGIPERYIVKYNAGIGIDDRKNEMYTFFKAVKPQIIVSHQPAHGIHDWLSHIGPSGSPALRTYCDNNDVLLCLTGHIHNQWGVKAVENTLYCNPSNFGEVTTTYGDVIEGGFFHQVEIHNNTVSHVLFRKVVDDRIYDIAEYTPQGDKWEETIIDPDRYNALMRYVNYDMKIKKYSHIPEIVLFKEIKQFFKLFQTRETEDRVDRLEKAIQLMEGKFDDIALDIVGSVNFGQAQPSSDIDIIVYIKNNGMNNMDCMQSDRVTDVKNAIGNYIGDEYKFEILDCIDLDIVEKSILHKDFECETTQRFVAYRSICKTINYRLIAPIEDMLNEDIEFRKELEGSIRSYLKVFATTPPHIQSFDKYQNRLKSVGITLPESIRKKISAYLQTEAPEEDENPEP